MTGLTNLPQALASITSAAIPWVFRRSGSGLSADGWFSRPTHRTSMPTWIRRGLFRPSIMWASSSEFDPARSLHSHAIHHFRWARLRASLRTGGDVERRAVLGPRLGGGRFFANEDDSSL